MRNLLTGLLVFVVLLACVPGQAYRLRYKDVAGTTRTYAMTMKMSGITEAMGTSMPMDSTTSMSLTEQVLAVKDGCATIKMEMKNGVTKVTLAAPPGEKEGKTIEQKVPDFSLQFDRTPLGKASNVQMSGNMPKINGMGNDWINRLVQQGSSMNLPDKELAIGDSWEDKQTLEILPGAKGDINVKNTLTGTRVVNGHTDLVIAITMTMSMVNGKMSVGAGNNAVTIHMDMDMNGKMESLFDPDLGVMVHGGGKTDMAMKMTLEGAKTMTTNMKMAMDQTIDLAP